MCMSRHFGKCGSISALLLLGFALVLPTYAQPIRPPELNLQYHRAEVAWRSGGSVLEAKARVDRVLARLPEDVQALKLRAQVLISLQKPMEAVMDARKATILDPMDGEAQLVLAEAAYAAGQEEQALVALGRAAEAEPVLNDAACHVRMSWLAAEMERMSWAEAFARTALALDARSPAAYYQLARVFTLQDRTDLAVEVIAQGLRNSLLNVDAMHNDPDLKPLLEHPTLQEFRR